MVVKGQWVALEVKCGIWDTGTRAQGHRDTSAEGAREVHKRGIRGTGYFSF